MSGRSRIVLRSGYRLERSRGRLAAREPVVALDPTILVVLEGKCGVTIGEARHDLEAPALALANAGVGFGAGPARSGSRLLATLRAPLVESVAGAAGIAGRGPVFFPRATATPAETVAMGASRIAVELDVDRSGRDRALDLAVELFALDLLREHATTDRTSRLEQSRAGLVDRRLRRSIELMHDNYARDLPLGEIAAAAYLSEYHFARLFKRITGQTPHAYLAGLRVEHACRLLAETDLSIAEVADRVGYQSASHFGKVFRTATGLTPTAYRDAVVS